MPTDAGGSTSQSQAGYMAVPIVSQVLTKPNHDVAWLTGEMLNTIPSSGFASQGGVNNVQFVLPNGVYWLNATALIRSSSGHTRISMHVYINGTALGEGVIGANDAYNAFISQINGAGGVDDEFGSASYSTILPITSQPSLVKMVLTYRSSTDGEAATVLSIGPTPLRGQWSIMKIG